MHLCTPEIPVSPKALLRVGPPETPAEGAGGCERTHEGLGPEGGAGAQLHAEDNDLGVTV